ncbi:MAG: hypothetical protein ABEI11_00080 [Haloarculaceae archaeon]
MSGAREQTTFEGLGLPTDDGEPFAGQHPGQRRLDGYDDAELPTREPIDPPGGFERAPATGPGTRRAWRSAPYHVAIVAVRTGDGLVYEIHVADRARPNPGRVAGESTDQARARELAVATMRALVAGEDGGTVSPK